jgi:uncharacterized protein YndB with AHSA1/START domain
MITEASIQIDAPATIVWEVFTDTERWHEWTESIRSIRPLDGPSIEVGHRFEIAQPRFPKLVWVVTAVEPGRSWTWEQRSPGGVTSATHEVVATAESTTTVRQVIDQRGPVGALVGRLTRRLTRRYLDLEARGLKRRSEQRRAADA